MSSDPIHAQQVRPAKLGMLCFGIAALEGGIGIALNLANLSIWPVLLLTGLMILFVLIGAAFWELRFVVRDSEIELGWGTPFRRVLPLAGIKGARVEPYKALKFGGWGWRMGAGGAWAYSDIGIKEALVLELASGKLIYITLKDPQAAAQAVAQALSGATPASP